MRFLYQIIRQKIVPYFNKDYTFSHVYKLPQLYRIHGPWNGLPLHTDNQIGRDLAMIVYISRNWKVTDGGKLCLHSSTGDIIEEIAPLFNRAVFFPLGSKSWHSVQPITSHWTRITLIQDWQVDLTI